MSRNDYRHAHSEIATFHDSARDFTDTAWRNLAPLPTRERTQPRDPFWPVVLVCFAILAIAASAAVSS